MKAFRHDESKRRKAGRQGESDWGQPSDDKGSLGDSANVQAVTSSKRRAGLEKLNAELTRPKNGEGCHFVGKRAKRAPTKSAGVVATACTEEEG